MKHENRGQSRYLAYLWIFAVGLTVLYSFSLLPRPTGFAVMPSIEACGGYFGDGHCDDSPEDCGVYYDLQNNVRSLDICNECQTSGFDCTQP